MITVKAMPADATCCGCKVKVVGTGYVIEGRFFYELLCRTCVGELTAKLTALVVQIAKDQA